MALANECGFPEGCGITQSEGSYHPSLPLAKACL